ncbi:MAG: phosphoglycerate dehydrogenase [Bacteroidia bacterium]
MKATIVIDFDSTFTQVEALEELAEISLKNSPQKAEVVRKIKEITDLGMAGSLSFHESLSQRLALLPLKKEHLEKVISRLKRKISPSFQRNKAFFKKYQGQIYILSLGFREFIAPVVKEYFIDDDHVLANTFVFDETGKITGFDEKNVLAHSKGKSNQLRTMDLQGEIYIIGDSYTDYEAKESGIAHRFYAFTENILRDGILEKADHVLPSFDEFLYINQLQMSISYPKNRIKVLLLENIHAQALDLFQKEGYQVETLTGAPTEEELCEKIQGVKILGIRSKSQITDKVLASATNLMAIGAFCIGTNQINLNSAAEKGIITFNAPYSNTRSVVELAIGEIIMLMRKIPLVNQLLHQGKWQKSAKGAHEIRGKKLGIVGYGNIGAQLSVLAENLGMEVYYYDVVEKLALGNAKKCNSLHELLKKVDIVSLHVDGRKENTHCFGEKEFQKMKKGAIFLNLCRGMVVDIEALVKNLKNGKLGGAAVDVFPYEPHHNNEEFVSELRNLENVILTPHIGGSTEEAQENIANYVPKRIIDYVNTGNTFGAVNFPILQLSVQKNVHRLIHIHQNVPGILAKINQIFAEHNVNIEGQYLKTSENIGYVITDINKAYSDAVLGDLKKIEHTIKFRVLY